jgi:hypothetical protein
MLTPQAYVDILESKGRPLPELGVRFALGRADALDGIAALAGSAVAIAGGDVIRLESGRPQYTYDNWHADRREAESLADYLKRSWETARAYVRQYPDPEDGTILYDLVVAELAVPGSAYMT